MKRLMTIAILMGAMIVTAKSASAAQYVYANGYSPYVSTYYPGYYAPRVAYRRPIAVPAYSYYTTPGYVTTPTYYAPYPTTNYYQPYTYGYRAPAPYVYSGYGYGY